MIRGLGEFTPDYKKLYSLLFNAFTDAVDALRACNYGQAMDILMAAQLRAEDQYLEDAEEASRAENEDDDWVESDFIDDDDDIGDGYVSAIIDVDDDIGVDYISDSFLHSDYIPGIDLGVDDGNGTGNAIHINAGGTGGNKDN